MGMRESAMGATDRLVQFITDTHYDALPGEVVSAAKIGIMDGVANMRSRLEKLGGRFEATGEPGRGTRLRLCVPAG